MRTAPQSMALRPRLPAVGRKVVGQVRSCLTGARRARPASRPIFEADRVTLQPLFWGFACFPAALLGVIEASIADTAEKNRVCPPIRYWDEPRDYLSSYLARMAYERASAGHPAVAAWAQGTRLNPLSGLRAHAAHPLVVQTREDIKAYGAAAAGNLVKLLR